MKPIQTAMLSVMWLLCLLPQLTRADENRLQIGDPAPDWKDLRGTDGKTWSAADFADSEVLVICFTSNSCLYSQDYEARMADFCRKYQNVPQGVKLVAINSSQKASDSFDRMQERAIEKKFPYPYLDDQDQSVARSWGAIFTPEFFVLNKERKVIYIGAMDDQTMADKVTKRHVEDAVDAALQGRLPEVTAVPARGCRIPFRRSSR